MCETYNIKRTEQDFQDWILCTENKCKKEHLVHVINKVSMQQFRMQAKMCVTTKRYCTFHYDTVTLKLKIAIITKIVIVDSYASRSEKCFYSNIQDLSNLIDEFDYLLIFTAS